MKPLRNALDRLEPIETEQHPTRYKLADRGHSYESELYIGMSNNQY